MQNSSKKVSTIKITFDIIGEGEGTLNTNNSVMVFHNTEHGVYRSDTISNVPAGTYKIHITSVDYQDSSFNGPWINITIFNPIRSVIVPK